MTTGESSQEASAPAAARPNRWSSRSIPKRARFPLSSRQPAASWASPSQTWRPALSPRLARSQAAVAAIASSQPAQLPDSLESRAWGPCGAQKQPARRRSARQSSASSRLAARRLKALASLGPRFCPMNSARQRETKVPQAGLSRDRLRRASRVVRPSLRAGFRQHAILRPLLHFRVPLGCCYRFLHHLTLGAPKLQPSFRPWTS